MSLPTLRNSVQTLQKALQAKAKAEPSYPWLAKLWEELRRKSHISLPLLRVGVKRWGCILSPLVGHTC